MDNFQRCRICISESAVMMSIFGEDALWRKIAYFANVQIEEGDSLPQQICVMCAKNAINAYSFKQKCERSDRFFRKQSREKTDDVISISSAEANEDQAESKCDKYEFGFWNFIKAKSPPVLEEDASRHPSECNHEQHEDWTGDQNAPREQDDSEHLPLVPEIELITPNDDDRKTANGYQCSICFEFFAMKSILKHHVKVKHPEANPTFECFECKKTYLSKRFLDKHIRRGRCVKKRKNHSRAVQCADCHESFPSGHHLGWHKRSGSCPSHKHDTLNNFTPVAAGWHYSDSDEEKQDESSKTEKDNSSISKKKRYRRTRWTHAKRKVAGGRGRVRLDSDQIELAKQLILQEASTSMMAQELKISRTYAWKLRKTLDLFNSPQNPEGNCPNDGQMENKQGQIQPEALNLSKKPEPPRLQSLVHNKGQEKPQENGQVNLRPGGESEDDDEVGRRGEVDSEATESADESRQDGVKAVESLDASNIPSRPSCSQNSVDTPPPAVLPNNTDNFSPVSNDSKIDPVAAPPYKRRPRKPNVFMTPEKYEQAKELVANRATTMEVAKHLNISQMSAWKLRDNILKGIPMTFKSPAAPRPKEPPIPIPRQKLRGIQRRERHKQITEAILTMIREDKTIQYWKVSEKLAEKGLYLSASSVCQRLKSMGIHRRFPPERMENEEAADSTDSAGDDDNSSSVCGTTDTSQFLSTSFMT